jgi:peptide/nickel transport system substrate-binding protein
VSDSPDIPDPISAGESTEAGLDRKELLARGAVVGAAAVAAGSLAGKATAASKRVGGGGGPKRGGKVTFALEQDPVHIAPFGAILTSNHWGKEPMYESLVEWDANLNQRPALAQSWKVVDNRTIDFTLRRGVRFHNGKEVTAADVKYSIEQQLNPPLPGSVATLGQVPSIQAAEVRSRYVVRIRLSKPDARLFGYFAWTRYSAIVPEGMYQQVNAGREGIGTGPFRLVSYVPGQGVEYARFANYRKRGQPFLNQLSLRTLPDEQSRIAALRAGAIDGATLSADGARSFQGNNQFRVLRGLTAAFRELQMTQKPGENKPWHDRRVRQAVNHAINRQEILNRVYGGFGEYSGHVPPGYGPWPLTRAELRNNYLKHDLAKARNLMRQAGFANGFEVTMSTFSTPLDFGQVAAVIKAQLDRIGIDVTIRAEEPGTFAANNGAGRFEWDLTARGMRGDVDGYTAEFNPASNAYKAWYPGYRHARMWKLVGNGSITLDEKKRLAMYKELQRILLTEQLQVPLVAVTKFQVVRRRVRNMYVAFSDFNTGLKTAWVE